MVYFCTPCFLQCQVTLHPSKQCCAWESQEHASKAAWSSVWLSSVSATKSPTRRGVPLPNCQSQLLWTTSSPCTHCSRSCLLRWTNLCCLAAAMWAFGPLVLTVLVGDCRCRVPVQKQGKGWTRPLARAQHVLAGNHKEDGRGGRLIKFLHSSSLHWAVLGWIQLLKGAEEHLLQPDVIWAMGVVGRAWWPAVLGSHIASEKQLGASGWAHQHSGLGSHQH